ncbi:acyl-ACP--UDP-N-acetylglucosamine O-acyltransferase [Maioricimonas sp. JC845]|uniref:acyl-ACP--UDP-N-acetylglucosamine O-acyltransferase n=1 Tax=Maioricimonas sp. JC845 TaxID=3232138 RepID=UPI00345A2CF9
MPIHPSAIIDAAAEIDPTVTIGPHAVIDGPVRIGPHCRIAPSVVIMGHTTIGAECEIHAHAVIGDTPQDHAYEDGLSYCVIGNGCVLREGVTVHRGTADGSSTVIGDDCLLMTNSHVGHNCQVGDHATLISGALLGGHVTVGPRAVISGNAAVHQFVRIGELAMISGLGKIVKDVPPFFMTDRDGAIVGVNRIGLLRAGLSSDERREINNAFRLIYRSPGGREAMIQRLDESLTTEAGRRLLAFMTEDSPRGVTRGRNRTMQKT